MNRFAVSFSGWLLFGSSLALNVTAPICDYDPEPTIMILAVFGAIAMVGVCLVIYGLFGGERGNGNK